MFERIMALHVTDEAGYQAYRAEMTPLLAAIGGSFRYDFRVGETLKNAADHPINRIFVISFPSERAAEDYFADARYREIRARLFDASVAGITQLGTNQGEA